MAPHDIFAVCGHDSGSNTYELERLAKIAGKALPRGLTTGVLQARQMPGSPARAIALQLTRENWMSCT
jgi:hypothetical protein